MLSHFLDMNGQFSFLTPFDIGIRLIGILMGF